MLRVQDMPEDVARSWGSGALLGQGMEEEAGRGRCRQLLAGSFRQQIALLQQLLKDLQYLQGTTQSTRLSCHWLLLILTMLPFRAGQLQHCTMLRAEMTTAC